MEQDVLDPIKVAKTKVRATMMTFIGNIFTFAFGALILAIVTKWLWNFVMVDLGLPAITFWKAFALNYLAWILTAYGRDVGKCSDKK